MEPCCGSSLSSSAIPKTANPFTELLATAVMRRGTNDFMATSDIEGYCPECRDKVTPVWSDLAIRRYCPRCGEEIWFSLEKVGDVAFLTLVPEAGPLHGDGDIPCFCQIRQVVSDLPAPARVVLNLRHLNVVSSAFLNVCLRVLGVVSRTSGSLALCSARPEVKDAFRCTGSPVLEVCPDEQAALDFVLRSLPQSQPGRG